MGFWDFLNRPARRVYTPQVTYVGGPGWDELVAAAGMTEYVGGSLASATPAQLWRTQPHLRTVVDFLARNIAQLGVHVFVRESDTDRTRDRTSPLAQALSRPNPDMTRYDLIFALVGDMALYDRAYWHVFLSSDGWVIRRLPPSWVAPVPRDVFGAKAYDVTNAQGDTVQVPAGEILAFSGYHPVDPVGASPAVDALRDTLEEQIKAAQYRGQVWKRGGRVSAVLERPAGAPKWGPEARKAFREDWYANYTGSGPRAGGTPILEDGMTLNRIDFNAQEQQYVEAAKLSLTTVAAAFHVNPTMIGVLDNANYSNVREFRRMLYGDTLGPLLAKIEARLNAFLIPMLGMDGRYYAEFNIAEKLEGTFEEQAQVMQTMVGAPIMTRNEARARFNLSALDAGDQLVTPLNVLVGGQASPTDSGSQNIGKTGRALTKGRAPDAHDAKHVEVLTDFFARQRRTVASRLGAKSPDWWDGERWDAELKADLYRLALLTATAAGRAALEAVGVDPDTYDEKITKAYLDKRSGTAAANINAQTLQRIEEGLIEGSAADALDSAYGDTESRAATLAASAVTALSGFGTHEAGKQSGATTKTWITGKNPRPEHARLNGETVKLSEQFSNGLAWPGDAAGGADEVAGCNCSIRFDF